MDPVEKLVKVFQADFPPNIDESDYGNFIGSAMAQLPPFRSKNSLDLHAFISGFRHGVSCIDGTHDDDEKEGIIIKRDGFLRTQFKVLDTPYVIYACMFPAVESGKSPRVEVQKELKMTAPYCTFSLAKSLRVISNRDSVLSQAEIDDVKKILSKIRGPLLKHWALEYDSAELLNYIREIIPIHETPEKKAP